MLPFCLILGLVLTGTACGKKEAPAPAPSSRLIGRSSEEAPPETEEPDTVLIRVPVRKDRNSDARWIVSLHCPADWEYDGVSVNLAAKKLLEVGWYSMAEEPEPGPGSEWYCQLRDREGEEKTVGDRVFRVIKEECTLVDQEDARGYPYLIYNYYTAEEGGYWGFRFFQNQETMPVSLETFEAVLSTMTIREDRPEEAPPPAQSPGTAVPGTVRFQIPFCPQGEDLPAFTLSLFCPADWENGGSSIDLAEKKLIEVSWHLKKEEPDPEFDQWYQLIQQGEEKTLAGRTFRVYPEEYFLLDQVEKKQHPFIIYRYYTEMAEGYCGLIFFQNQDTMPVSLETFEEVLSTLSIREGGPEEGGVVLTRHHITG